MATDKKNSPKKGAKAQPSKSKPAKETAKGKPGLNINPK